MKQDQIRWFVYIVASIVRGAALSRPVLSVCVCVCVCVCVSVDLYNTLSRWWCPRTLPCSSSLTFSDVQNCV